MNIHCASPASPCPPPLGGGRLPARSHHGAAARRREDRGPFTLVNQDGRTVTDRDFAGKYRIMYFG